MTFSPLDSSRFYSSLALTLLLKPLGSWREVRSFHEGGLEVLS